MEASRRISKAVIREVGSARNPVDGASTREFCTLEADAEALLQNAIDRRGFSARANDKVLRDARRLADLDVAEKIEEPHVGEAIQYRNLGRQVL